MEAITLDAEHRYWKGKERLPGFSEICADMGFPKNPFWTDAGRDEGTALHQWVEFLALGQQVADADPDPRIAGRVDGFRKFRRETDFACAGAESIQFEPELRYCCKPDLWGYMPTALPGSPRVVIEVKRGARAKVHKLQTAAQVLALRAGGFDATERYALYLKNGGYALERHDDDEDFECWKALVYAYHAKRRYL
jgi:hypothetical protein